MKDGMMNVMCGSLLSIVVTLSMGDLVKSGVLAVVGTATSVLVSTLMRKVLKS